MADKKNNVDDDTLWQHVADGIAPLDKRHKNIATEKVPAASPQEEKTAPKKRSYRTDAAPPPPRKTFQPELEHGTSPGLDKSTAKKLKQGKLPIEARMDLHGMTQQQAHRALDSFIDGAYGAGRRCVLVVTGKGLKPDGSIGVLRQMAPVWLNSADNRPRILAFCHAVAKDGGEGALYVMLKRKR